MLGGFSFLLRTRFFFGKQQLEPTKILAVSDPLNDNTYMNMKHCPTCNDYKLLQQNHQVYCDEPGPDCDGKPYTDFVDENTFKHKFT